MEKIDFSKNYKTDVAKLGIKEIKQNKFSYLSWAHCQKVMKEMDQNSYYKLIYNENDCSYIWGGMVRVELFFDGKTVEHAYPVLDGFNNGIKNINGKWHFVTKPTKANPKSQIKEEVTSFDINNAQMRGFAKLFSMETGIGLNIFTGEDLEQYKKIDDAQGDQAKTEEKAKNNAIKINDLQQQLVAVSNEKTKKYENKKEMMKTAGITAKEFVSIFESGDIVALEELLGKIEKV